MTNDKSGVWETGENSGANAMADENPVNDYMYWALPGPATVSLFDEFSFPTKENSGKGREVLGVPRSRPRR